MRAQVAYSYILHARACDFYFSAYDFAKEAESIFVVLCHYSVCTSSLQLYTSCKGLWFLLLSLGLCKVNSKCCVFTYESNPQCIIRNLPHDCRHGLPEKSNGHQNESSDQGVQWPMEVLWYQKGLELLQWTPLHCAGMKAMPI